MYRLPRTGACPNFVIDEDDDSPLTTAAAEGTLEVLLLVGLGRIVASYYRSSILYIIFTDKFGTSISETTMRPNPRCCRRCWRAAPT